MSYLITGAAGFIGSNLAARLMAAGDQVIGIDNAGRKGAMENVQRLEAMKRFEFIKGDICDADFLVQTFARHRHAKAVFHLAGQVAVTTSVANPRADFNSNALGTLNVLEAVRLNDIQAPVIYSSTNKVYGKMDDLTVVERGGRYVYRDLPQGVREDRPLDFHSPYGCSKGAGDQYIIDYARIFGVRSVCLRQSCIYGYHQYGIEDQGWVAWFTIASLLGKPLTIYGDGKQLRDVLFIDDLIDAYLAAIQHIDRTAGNAYNIGGGAANTLSLLELIGLLENRLGRKIPVTFSDWRPGDQKVFVCDIAKAQADFGWSPRVSAQQGVGKLFDWAAENLDRLKTIFR